MVAVWHGGITINGTLTAALLAAVFLYPPKRLQLLADCRYLCIRTAN
nr:hypothetical protein [Paenibacillus sp. J23TS9]